MNNRIKNFFFLFILCVCSVSNIRGMTAQYEINKKILTFDANKLQIKKSGAVVGYIQDHKIYTCFPHRVNQHAYADIADLMAFLNENSLEKQGKWYLNTNTGECGFYMEIPSGISTFAAFEKYWNTVNLYALYPELSNLNHREYPMEYIRYSLKEYPLDIRTAAELENLDKVTANLWKNEKRNSFSKPEHPFEIRKISVKQPDYSAEDIEVDADYFRMKGEKSMYSSLDLPILYFTLAAAKGDWHSQQKLAWLLEEKTEQDEKQIFNLYKNAAEKGFCNCCPQGLAAIDLARCYWFGIGTQADRKKAFELASEFLKEYPENKNAILITGLWYFYETAEKKLGMSLIEKAGKGGFMPAVLEHCIIHEYGLGGKPQEINNASNFSLASPANTVHAWLAGYWLNAKNYERWVKSGGDHNYLGF